MHEIRALSERLRTVAQLFECWLGNCVLQDYCIRILEVYDNFKYWTRYDELLIM